MSARFGSACSNRSKAGAVGIRGRTLSTPGHAWRSIQQEVIPSAKVLRGNLVAVLACLRQAGLELLRCMYTPFCFLARFSPGPLHEPCVPCIFQPRHLKQGATMAALKHGNLQLACLSKGSCPSDCHAFRTLRPLKRVVGAAGLQSRAPIKCRPKRPKHSCRMVNRSLRRTVAWLHRVESVPPFWVPQTLLIASWLSNGKRPMRHCWRMLERHWSPRLAVPMFSRVDEPLLL